MARRFAVVGVVVIVWCALAGTSPAHAVVPGGPPNPIQALIDAAQPGDTIDVPPGEYVGGIDFKNKDIVVRSTGGAGVTTINGNGAVGVTMGPGGTLQGFTIKFAYGSFGAGLVSQGVGSRIIANVFDGNAQGAGGFGAGIAGNGASPTIIGNTFMHNTCDGQFLSGVVAFVNSSSPKIINNLFYDNPCRGINLTLPVGNNPVVVNNTIVNSQTAIREDGRVSLAGHLIRNNILANNAVGFQVEFGTTPPQYDHNLLWANGTDYMGVASQTGLNANVHANPRFADAAAKDFKIDAGSAAVDHGGVGQVPSTDFDGTARPLDGDLDGTAVIDMGAYEARPDARFHPLSPARVLDTRNGTGAPAARLGAGSTLDLQISGAGGVPSTGVSAVAINVTAVDPSSDSHLTVWPAGVPKPLASNLNLTAGRTLANADQVRLGAAGRISVFNNDGTTDVLIDVVGWYDTGTAGGGRFEAVQPSRIMDTRVLQGGPTLGPAEARSFQVLGVAGIPGSGVSAVVVNVTAVRPTLPTHLSLFPTASGVPPTSTLNAPAGAVVPNLAVVPVTPGGNISVYNNSGDVDVLVDVLGWFDDGTINRTGGLVPMTPNRVLDTRFGVGAPPVRVGAGQSIDLTVTGTPGVDAGGVAAVALNVIAVAPSSASHVTVWPAGAPMPPTSNLNLDAGRTVANLVITKVGAGGKVTIYNNSGTVDLVADVMGWYTAPVP